MNGGTGFGGNNRKNNIYSELQGTGSYGVP